MLLGEAAIKGIWLAREFIRSGVGRHMQSVRLSKAKMAFEEAVEAVSAHDRQEQEEREKERLAKPQPPKDPLALKQELRLLRAMSRHREPKGGKQ